MKRLLLSMLALVSLLMPFSVATAAAYNPFGPACGVKNSDANTTSSACSTNGKNTLVGKHGYLRKASFIIASIAGVAAVIVMVIGGLQYVVSAGDPQKATNARNAIIGAAIGLGIIVAAQAIIVFILSRLQ